MSRTLIPVIFSEEELDRELEDLLREPATHTEETHPSFISGLIDSSSADSNNSKTQDQWITYWNAVTDGRVMASMSDYYAHFKQLREQSERGNAKQKAEAQTRLNSFQTDFNQSWIVSSTRLSYYHTSFNGTITQHYGCHRRNLIAQQNLAIPVYQGTSITEVVKSGDGLTYLQQLLGTADPSETIVNTLEYVSGKARNEIKVWTADTSNRGSDSERAAGFICSSSEFHVDGDNYILDLGRSRGVKVSPR